MYCSRESCLTTPNSDLFVEYWTLESSFPPWPEYIFHMLSWGSWKSLCIIYHFLSGSVAPFLCMLSWGKLLNLHVGEYSGLFYMVSPRLGGSSVRTSSDLNCPQIQISLAPSKVQPGQSNKENFPWRPLECAKIVISFYRTLDQESIIAIGKWFSGQILFSIQGQN